MSYTIAVPVSSIQKATTYGANVSIIGTGVTFGDGTTVTSSYPATSYADPAYQQANTATVLSQAAFNYANTLSLGAAIDAFARANTYYLSGVDATQNTRISLAYSQANTGTVLAQAAFNSANNVAPQIQPSFNQANTATVLAQASFDYANTRQNIQTSASPTFNGLILTNALAISQGGTGATSAAAALTNLLPSGTTSGYVLTTGGPGTFYWAAGGGGGGGATPGTTIASTRLSYTGNSAGLSYTTPTYVPGASQLRVYYDGVRQFASEYTETNSTTVTFTSSPPTGVVILIEVDGYINNPYYANNIPFTINSTISPTANTIQQAIDGLASKVAYTGGSTFTGLVTAPTPPINSSNTQIATTAFVRSILPTGVILMWSGAISNIPSGWYLCDGTNGTPDLRDRFVVGAGSTYAVAATGGSANAIVVAHTHTATTSSYNHTHFAATSGSGSPGGGPYMGNYNPGNADNFKPSLSGSTSTPDICTTSTDTHSHTLTTDSTGVSGTNANLPPYYALAYIMKS